MMGLPSYVQVMPLQLAASFSFLGVLRTELDSILVGLYTEKDDLDNLFQEPAAEVDDDSRRIRAKGTCFLPSELVVALYELGARPTITEVAPQLLARVIALGKDIPVYRNVLDWFQDSFTKVFWKKHPTLSFWEGLIRTGWSWEASVVMPLHITRQ